MSLEIRIDKLEQAWAAAGAVPLVARQVGTGFQWNGQLFQDEAAFDAAVDASGASGKLIVIDG
ncbi:hypothetical protein [Desulfatirhabdium butyrativorans]|uniref:hypothetical protein n=1 Tax=Desulfatirhabdium butyrativorans TaxID=340467 RepID=UPI000482F5BC|nr:hypothetical protein [Desulfatirhabdium butyrativorans]